MNLADLYHYPAEPGAIRSISYPELFVAGIELDMLRADMIQTDRAAFNAEQFLIDALDEMAQTHGVNRHGARRWVRCCIEALRTARRRKTEAWSRWHAARPVISASVTRVAA